MLKRSTLLQEELERMAREREMSEREETRLRRVDLFRVCVECLASCGLGLFLIGWAMHTTDLATGQIAFWAGLLMGYGGIVLSLFSFYRRGEERGDW